MCVTSVGCDIGLDEVSYIHDHIHSLRALD